MEAKKIEDKEADSVRTKRMLSAFIGDTCFADLDAGGYIFGESKNGLQLVAEVRGWGAIQNLYKNDDGTIDFARAEKFQDSLAEFIAEAITEKLQRIKDR